MRTTQNGLLKHLIISSLINREMAGINCLLSTSNSSNGPKYREDITYASSSLCSHVPQEKGKEKETMC